MFLLKNEPTHQKRLTLYLHVLNLNFYFRNNKQHMYNKATATRFKRLEPRQTLNFMVQCFNGEHRKIIIQTKACSCLTYRIYNGINLLK